MKTRNRFTALALAAFVALAAFLAPPSSAAEDGAAYFVDLLYLQEGKTPADAQAYFDKIEPIVARHGLKRAAPRFVVTKMMSGGVEPNLVHLWTVSDPNGTFDKIFNDPAYLENVPTRDATFDMKRSHMFMLQAIE